MKHRTADPACAALAGTHRSVDENGWTALHHAVAQNNLDEVRRLITIGADVNHRNRFGQTALMRASWHRGLRVMRCLLNAGADIDRQDQDSARSALMYAVWNDKPDNLRLLLQRGANPDLRDREGWTALMHTVLTSDTRCTRLLLAHGANPLVTNHAGHTTLDVFVDNERADLVAVLDETLASPTRVSHRQRLLEPLSSARRLELLPKASAAEAAALQTWHRSPATHKLGN